MKKMNNEKKKNTEKKKKMRRYRKTFSISLLFNDGSQFVESVTSILRKGKLSLWT